MELWINEFWIFVTAVIYTAVGFWFGTKSNIGKITESVIDSLIEQKYLKTKGYGDNLEILKWTEWND